MVIAACYDAFLGAVHIECRYRRVMRCLFGEVGECDFGRRSASDRRFDRGDARSAGLRGGVGMFHGREGVFDFPVALSGLLV